MLVCLLSLLSSFKSLGKILFKEFVTSFVLFVTAKSRSYSRLGIKALVFLINDFEFWLISSNSKFHYASRSTLNMIYLQRTFKKHGNSCVMLVPF